MTAFPHILFGKGSLPVPLPPDVQVTELRKPVMPPLTHAMEAVEECLHRAIACPSLPELAGKATSACIVICDITRPVPNGLILPPLIRMMMAACIPAERIVVLVATGLHRPNLGDELRELIGNDWVMETVQVVNHDARNAAENVMLGSTPAGTPVGLDRHFVEADLKIVTGLVEPHFMAGYSGGRKVIAPGIAHENTIRTFHNTGFMEDPLARSCNLEGNPLHREQLAIVKMLGDVYAVNTVINESKDLCYVNFGEVIASHAQAVAFSREYAEVPVNERADLVITSSAGYPLDKTYYQTVKGIVCALGALKKGGTLLIASECSEGVGSHEFRAAQETLVREGFENFLTQARTRPLANIDEWQTVKLAEALRHARVRLYAPGLKSVEDRNLTGVHCHEDWNEALAVAVEETGAKHAILIPEGPYVIPMA